jgi:queuine tRNA-ribosyltransferase
MFTITHKEGKARSGILKGPKGEAQTPFFMPVATKAVGRFVSTDDYKRSNTQAIICNQFLLSLKPGLETFDTLGTIHDFMHFDGLVFTDCGGFQMLRESLLIGTTKNGIKFKSPYGGTSFMKPEKSMDIGKRVGSDVIMALDCVLPFGKVHQDFKDALEKSHSWTKRCRELHDSKQLLFGITQGGTFKDLREESAKFINSLDFDGHAIGGVAIGEAYDTMYDIIDASIPHLDDDKPRYVMGVGKPDQILECIERGIDIFDSIYPQKNGRHGMMFTFNGIMDLGKSIYKYDKKPIEEGCKCYVCTHYSRAYLRYLYKKDDAVGKRYLTMHNLYFMHEFMRRIRESIKNNTFKEFKEEFLEGFKKIKV